MNEHQQVGLQDLAQRDTPGNGVGSQYVFEMLLLQHFVNLLSFHESERLGIRKIHFRQRNNILRLIRLGLEQSHAVLQRTTA